MQLRVRAHALLADRDELERLEPAFEMSTEERRIENGSASTTLSAVTVFVAAAAANVSVNVPAGSATATSSDPVVIWPGSAAASRSVI